MASDEPADLVIVPTSSAILVDARSSVGGIAFGTTSVSGRFRTVRSDTPSGLTLVEAHATVPVASLTSGNRLYDNELHQRLNALRYPDITAHLRSLSDLGEGRVQIEGDLTIHGETRVYSCAAQVDATTSEPDQASVVVAGSVVVDIRDFDISLPSMMMLKIYPEVTVRFRVMATRDPATTEVS